MDRGKIDKKRKSGQSACPSTSKKPNVNSSSSQPPVDTSADFFDSSLPEVSTRGDTLEVVFSAVDPIVRLSKLSPFAVFKAVNNICGGEISTTKRLQDGRLIVVARNVNQYKKLLNVKVFLNIPVLVSSGSVPEKSIRGVIFSEELMLERETILLDYLRDQGVTEVRRLNKGAEKTPTGLLVLTFNSDKLPEFILAGYDKYRVRTYYPNPYQCYNCYRYGHAALKCNRTQVTCNFCGTVGHQSASCEEMETYVVKSSSFIPKINSAHNLIASSDFEDLIKYKWQAAMKNDAFNYKVENIKGTILPGRFGYLIHLVKERTTGRRKPDTLLSMKEPFQPEKFNFTKIKPIEFLLNFDATILQSEKDNYDYKLEASIIINNAPLGYCHSLIVPNLKGCNIQKADKEGLAICIAAILLSKSASMKIGFNSLCAHASVNHYHYHLYYLDYKIPVEDAEVEEIGGGCYTLKNYFCNGFVFELCNGNIFDLVNNVMKLLDILIEEEIPYNISITRGTKLIFSQTNKDIYDGLRVTVFPRKASHELDLPEETCYPACCELAGHIPIYYEALWGSIKEEDITNVMFKACNEFYLKALPIVKSTFATK